MLRNGAQHATNMAPEKFKNGSQYAMKGCRYEMKLENGAQCCCNKFDCRLFISKFSQFAFYLSHSLSVILKSLAQPCFKCCKLSVSVVLKCAIHHKGDVCEEQHPCIYVA